MKKKKVKKEFVRKEINYWLDYDSPYTEFLPARFKEWSPNPN
jgi:2-hydroxychromene-2-carboxylate isomerase